MGRQPTPRASASATPHERWCRACSACFRSSGGRAEPGGRALTGQMWQGCKVGVLGPRFCHPRGRVLQPGRLGGGGGLGGRAGNPPSPSRAMATRSSGADMSVRDAPSLMIGSCTGTLQGRGMMDDSGQEGENQVDKCAPAEKGKTLADLCRRARVLGTVTTL